jgi:hypothetical protein
VISLKKRGLQFNGSGLKNGIKEIDNQKICFIYCVNNQQLFEASVMHLNILKIPVGIEIEVISIEGAPSITAGYNQAMRESDAKYKVYLHQDVFIINPNFIYEVIKLFQENPKLGMLGLAGSKYMPNSLIWWESKHKYGKVYDSHLGKMGLLRFNDVLNDYESVAAVDGLLIATQYDLPWRDDLFHGWHYYDISQAMEFIAAQYEVGIPRQEEPWAIHNCGRINTNGFHEAREIFINSYNDLKTRYTQYFQD